MRDPETRAVSPQGCEGSKQQPACRGGPLPLDRLRALSARSDRKGLAQLGQHVTALLGSAALVWSAAGTIWWLAALLLHGVVLIALFAPLHETVHRTAFRSRELNGLVSGMCGFLLLLPPRYFRVFHLAHHRHTQDPDHDPELATPKPGTLPRYLWQVSGIPYWQERATTLGRHAMGQVGEPFIARREKPAIIREARLHLSMYAIVAVTGSTAGGSWLIDLWWLPALLGQPVLRLFLLAEHSGCPQVSDMRRNSRTTSSNALIRRLTWNMPYHSEHHIYPGVPFHALPAAHRYLSPQIEAQAAGYVAVHRAILADIRNKPGPKSRRQTWKSISRR